MLRFDHEGWDEQGVQELEEQGVPIGNAADEQQDAKQHMQEGALAELLEAAGVDCEIAGAGFSHAPVSHDYGFWNRHQENTVITW